MAVKKITGLQVQVKGETTDFKKALRTVEQDITTTNASLKKLNKSLKLDPTNTELLRQKQALLKEAVKDTTQEIEDFKDIQKQLDEQGVDKLSNQYQELNLKIANAEDSLKKLRDEQVKLGSINLNNLTSSLDKASTKLGTLSKNTTAMSIAMTTLMGGLIKTTMSYETQIAQIEKITGDLSESTVQNLKDITVETGSAFSNISDFATIGAALGIAEQDLSAFTKTLKDLETVTNGTITGEEGGKMVARFLNVMGIGTDQVSNFGSALTIVEDSLAVTADEVLMMASRLAGLKQIGNISQHDLIGLGAVIKNLGLATESSSSAISRTFMQIEQAVGTNSEKLQDYARVAGMSAEEFANAWETKPMEAFLKFSDGIKGSVFHEIDDAVQTGSASLEQFAEVANMSAQDFANAWSVNKNDAFEQYVNGLQSLGDEAESSAVILKDLGLTNVRTTETLLKLAGNGDQVREMIETSNKAWNENTALTDKANRLYETTEYQLKGLWEKVKQLGASFGELLLPTINDVIDVTSDFIDIINDLPDGTKKAVVGVGLLSAGLSPLAKVGSVATKGLSKLTSGLNKLIGATREGMQPTSTYVAQISALATKLGPLGIGGLALSASTGLGVLLGTLVKINDPIYQISKSIDDTKQSLEEAKQSASANYLNELVDVVQADKQASSLQYLIDQISNTDKGTQDYATTLERLQGRLSEFNSTVGTSYVWDNEQQALKDTQGEVINLEKEYENLRNEMLQTSWLEANQQAYTEALKAQQSYQEQASGLAQELQQIVSSLPEELQGLWQQYGLDMIDMPSFQDYFKIDEQTASVLTGQIATIRGEIEGLAQAFSDNGDFIATFEKIQEMPAETFATYQKMGELDLVTESQFEQIDQLKQKVTDLNTEITTLEQANMNGMLDPMITDRQEQLKTIEEQLALLQEASGIAMEQASTNAQTIQDTATSAILTTATQGATDTETQYAGMLQRVDGKVTTTFNQTSEKAKTSIKQGTDTWDLWNPQSKDAYVNVHYNVVTPMPEYVSAFPQSYSAPEPQLQTMSLMRSPIETYENAFNSIASTNLQRFKKTTEKAQNTLDNARENDSFKKFESLLDKVQIQVVVRNDMDGREISSRVSTIQGLKLKKQSS